MNAIPFHALTTELAWTWSMVSIVYAHQDGKVLFVKMVSFKVEKNIK